MNTFKEHIEKFINMTNDNELVWKEITNFHHEFGCSYQCEYKNTSITLKHFSNFGIAFNTFSIDDVNLEVTEKQTLFSDLSNLFYSITKQIENKEIERMLKVLSKLDD